MSRPTARSSRGIALAFILCAAGTLGAVRAAGAAEELTFTYRPLAVGDQAQETISFLLDLKTTLAQAGQVVHRTDQVVERKERTIVRRLPAEPGQQAKAQITYDASQQTTSEPGGSAATSPRPVAGKTYLAARQGERLTITDAAGRIPPADELKIVARSMDGLGRPSPLGVFFDGRTIAVGQKVRLPQEFTGQLLAGWDESLARAPLDVILVGTQRVDGQRCALFHTLLDGTSAAGGAVQGRFVIEVDTCRAARVELSGPVSSAEQRGQQQGQYDVRRRGKLEVAVHIQHQRAER